MTSEMVQNLVNRAQLTYILLEVSEQSADPGYVMAWLSGLPDWAISREFCYPRVIAIFRISDMVPDFTFSFYTQYNFNLL